MPYEEIERIITDVETSFKKVTIEIPHFEIISPQLVPYGLKPHTRSICWLAEQVILQNVKANATEWGITNIEFPVSDICVWDVKISHINHPGVDIYINIKVTDVTRPVRNNDFASVKALVEFYDSNPDVILLCVIFPLRFQNTNIHFENFIIVKNYAWIDHFVINIRNKHLQALYTCGKLYRSSRNFIDLVKAEAVRRGFVFN